LNKKKYIYKNTFLGYNSFRRELFPSIPQRGLSQQLGGVDGIIHIVHGGNWVRGAEIDDRINADRHRIFGENFLGRNRVGNNPEEKWMKIVEIMMID
jgi:hypothetical protein